MLKYLHTNIAAIVTELANQYNLKYVFSEISNEHRIIMGDYPKGIVIWLSDNGQINYADDLAYHTLPYIEPPEDKPDPPFVPDPPRLATIETFRDKLIKQIDKLLTPKVLEHV
jgi:hypothetical protein